MAPTASEPVETDPPVARFPQSGREVGLFALSLSLCMHYHYQTHCRPGVFQSDLFEPLLRGYKHLLPVVSTINDRAQFERLKGAFDTAIIGFFRDLVGVWGGLKRCF